MTCIKQKLLLCVSPIFCLSSHKCYLRRSLCWKLYNRRSTYKTGPTLFYCETVWCPLLYVAYIYIFFSFSSSPLFLLCHRREKALEGKSKVSHSVHSPYFTDDKQEFWWCYISDRKNHALVTPPIHVTGLVEREEVELKFTAPAKPGMYFFCFIYAGP